MALRIFDYRCDECGDEKEALVDSDYHKGIVCHCGHVMYRIISAPRVLSIDGSEGQALRGIKEIQKKDAHRKLYNFT